MFGEFLNRPASFEAKEMAKAKRSSAAASMAQPADLQTLLDALPNMPLKDLRAVWAQKVGPPPPLRSPELLRRILAWRLQAAAYGDLPSSLKQALRNTNAAAKPALRLHDGVRLSREWRGRRHDVERTEAGYLYECKTYKSLSEIARAITGVRWSGPRFFGIQDREAA